LCKVFSFFVKILNTKTIKTNSLIVLKSIIIIVAVNVNNQIY
jgi:hypothetical protein